MNPLLGRWISADPLGVHAPGEADWNLYAYVHGAVLKAIDPVGLQEDERSREDLENDIVEYQEVIEQNEEAIGELWDSVDTEVDRDEQGRHLKAIGDLEKENEAYESMLQDARLELKRYETPTEQIADMVEAGEAPGRLGAGEPQRQERQRQEPPKGTTTQKGVSVGYCTIIECASFSPNYAYNSVTGERAINLSFSESAEFVQLPAITVGAFRETSKTDSLDEIEGWESSRGASILVYSVDKISGKRNAREAQDALGLTYPSLYEGESEQLTLTLGLPGTPVGVQMGKQWSFNLFKF